MKKITKKRLSIYLGAFMAVVILSMIVYAASRESSQPGEPPYGLAIQSDAKGTKLYGVAAIEFLNYGVDGEGKFMATDAKVVFQLRQGNDVQLFTGMHYGSLNLGDDPIPQIQSVLMDAVKDDILEHFFGPTHNPALKLKLKNVTNLVMDGLEFDSSCGGCCSCPEGCGTCICNGTTLKTSLFLVANVEFAVE
jgi:hypothetical protein